MRKPRNRTATSVCEMLEAEFLSHTNMSLDDLAVRLDVPVARLRDGDVDSGLATRLGEFFGTSAQFWLNVAACAR